MIQGLLAANEITGLVGEMAAPAPRDGTRRIFACRSFSDSPHCVGKRSRNQESGSGGDQRRSVESA